jgi:excisionase family DNA binding protein
MSSLEMLTVKEAADMSRLSKSTIERAINGKLPASPTLIHLRVGRRILIRAESLRRWLEALEGVHSAS